MMTPRARRSNVDCELGSAAIEFALLLPPVLWLLFGCLQLAVVYTAQGLLDNAAEAASRSVATGQAQTGNLSQAQFQAGLCAPLSSLFDCTRLMVDIRTVTQVSASDAAQPTITFDQSGQITNAWQFDLGGPNQLVVVRLIYLWPTVVIPGMDLSNLPNGKRVLVSTNVVRTESYQ